MMTPKLAPKIIPQKDFPDPRRKLSQDALQNMPYVGEPGPAFQNTIPGSSTLSYLAFVNPRRFHGDGRSLKIQL